MIELVASTNEENIFDPSSFVLALDSTCSFIPPSVRLFTVTVPAPVYRRYLSKEDFDTLAAGEEEANIGVVNLSAWSLVKLE